MALYGDILNLSRQAQRGPLSSWFECRLHNQINSGLFLPEMELQRIGDALVDELIGYRQQAGSRPQCWACQAAWTVRSPQPS